MSEKIVALFPYNNIKAQWFTPSGGGLSSRGYLYIAYRKIRAKSFDVGILKGTLKESNTKRWLNFDVYLN